MSKTNKGKKIVEVKAHTRVLKNGKKIKIHEHRRSTPDPRKK
jgi:hypothetical protein